MTTTPITAIRALTVLMDPARDYDETQKAALSLIDGLDEMARCTLLNACTDWANSDAGRDHRAGMAHNGDSDSPITAADVFGWMHDNLEMDVVEECEADLGIDNRE